MHRKRLLITGGSGFIGSRLVPVLTGQGYEVTILTRNPEKATQHFKHAVHTIKQLETLSDTDFFDVVINLAGQGITDKRWSQGTKKQLRDSRIITTQNLINAFLPTQYSPHICIK